ncbi:hypothetical protein ECG_05027 [Echinococcus granulosus]|uniref:Immunoglobulin n=1 Tax=Echinococcus granulosus TaxID=6210 RepID=U6JJL2_ECHGR|nr:hypothetical protein EGR_06328 [Echinococcus granulosus]EUB58779.1 hypothetical protein EGR_06328 [Echinococcus granulosus]KAH9282725.1 hypothetical protein ECG_05027 [Echinococcus granulosus]CDS24260.1 Immunoglobulin [Echinococcus granulosus]
MNLVTWLQLFLFVNVVFARSEITLISDTGDSPVLIGQSVTLRCTVSSRFAHQTNLSIIFLQNGTMKAENCKAYNTERYEVTCEAEGSTINSSTQTYLFHIKSVSWMDRGKWTCLLSGSSSDIFLEVHVPPKMLPIQVSRITLPSSGGLSSTRSSDPQTNNAGGVGVDLASHPPQIYGLGTRTNPYDLRSGVELHLICQTDCGYPRALPEWTVNNMSESQPRKLEPRRNVITQACDGKIETRNMSTSMVTLKVHCETFHLTGINKLRCAIGDSNDVAASKHIYILCPGGEIPMTLTSGEMIGLGVAAIALFALFVTGCVLLRGRSKESAIISSGHTRAELV